MLSFFISAPLAISRLAGSDTPPRSIQSRDPTALSSRSRSRPSLNSIGRSPHGDRIEALARPESLKSGATGCSNGSDRKSIANAPTRFNGRLNSPHLLCVHMPAALESISIQSIDRPYQSEHAHNDRVIDQAKRRTIHQPSTINHAAAALARPVPPPPPRPPRPPAGGRLPPPFPLCTSSSCRHAAGDRGPCRSQPEGRGAAVAPAAYGG